MSACFHAFGRDVAPAEWPVRFNCPFCYEPHPLCREAARAVGDYLRGRTDWADELARGKMFGVLVVRTAADHVGFLAAFSGLLAGTNLHDFFVPPVYDLLRPDGYFRREEQAIDALNRRIASGEASPALLSLREDLATACGEAEAQLAAARAQWQDGRRRRQARRAGAGTDELRRLEREAQYAKAELHRLRQRLRQRVDTAAARLAEAEAPLQALCAERRRRSAALQERLFASYRLLNARGEERTMAEVFRCVGRVPPGGSGECAAPKLLQYAYRHGLQPLAMAEFWWGASPQGEVRHHGRFYPSCKSKCEPILGFMLEGLDVMPNPLEAARRWTEPLRVVYEDEWLVAVDKPAGLLSVDGTSGQPSVLSLLREARPGAPVFFAVHRLDQDTSGLLLVAKEAGAYRRLQAQFASRQVSKQYVALVDGSVAADAGRIALPLRPDEADRPRQLVDPVRGKPALTDYRVAARGDGWARVCFQPLTGRTHQLRVHAAHAQGLNAPIRGDRLYGHPADRLYLHAEALSFDHPVTGRRVELRSPAPF